jgi:hypothetical protein
MLSLACCKPTYKGRTPERKTNSQRTCFREAGFANSHCIYHCHQKEGHNKLPTKSHALQHGVHTSAHIWHQEFLAAVFKLI